MIQTTTSSGIAQSPVLCDVYRSILSIFTSKEDGREWMHTPFFVGDKTVATNGTCLVAVPKFNDNYKDLSEKTKTVYPIEHNCNIEITINQLKEAISKAPLIDCYDETQQKCDACYGEGEVEFEFSHGLKDYTMEHECPVCDGQGIIYKTSTTPNGKKQIDYNKFIRIGTGAFNISRIEDLIKTAEMCNLQSVRLVKQTGANQSTLFVLNDVELLLMPVMCQTDDDVCANIA